MNAIQTKIVETARKYIGQTEVPGNMGFNDKVFQNKMEEVGFVKGHAWCAYFAELVWKEAYTALGMMAIVKDLDELFSASATNTYANMKAYPGSVAGKLPVPGSLAVWKYGQGWQGHIGIVTDVTDTTFNSVEGNTNDKGGREGYIVWEHTRQRIFTNNTSGLNLIGFIHPLIN